MGCCPISDLGFDCFRERMDHVLSRAEKGGARTMKMSIMAAVAAALLGVSVASAKEVHVFKIAAGHGPTNVAFGDGEKELYVTVVKDPEDPKYKGSIVKIPNVR